MSHRNIPIFIPHLGCPHQCIFCNQRSISGCQDFDEQNAESIIHTALSTISPEDEVEIAFFGGSFTGIDRDLMIRLLKTAQKYVDQGDAVSIRLSTRPDYISAEILEILSRYSVKHIELGLQSMADDVLLACRRGHTRERAINACRAVGDAGFSLTGQMMIGLPQSTPRNEIETAELICDLGATSVRIYPTVVFYQTPLATLAEEGHYQPLSLEEAVIRSASVLPVFVSRGVEILRIGLCASEGLTSCEKVLGGPNHPALGELVWNEYYYQQMDKLLSQKGWHGQDVTLTVPRGMISKVVGQKRCNLEKLAKISQTKVKRIQESMNATDLSVSLWQTD